MPTPAPAPSGVTSFPSPGQVGPTWPQPQPQAGLDDDLVKLVLEQYPQYAYLLAIPEVAQLLIEAVDPQRPFSPQEFTARLQATDWWKQNAGSVREWDALVAMDPASANAAIRGRMSEIRDIVEGLGFTLTDNQLYEYATQTLRFNIPLSSSEFRDSLALVIPDMPGTAATGGTFGATVLQIKQLAREYLMPLTEQEAWRMAEQVTLGTLNLDGLRATWAEEASRRSPAMAQAIASGLTPMQFFGPTRSIVANELEVDPTTIDLMDPRWSQILGIPGDDGTPRPMTQWEALQYARSQPEWRGTRTANELAASAARQFIEGFGQAAF